MNSYKILIFSSCLFLLPFLNIAFFSEDKPNNYEKQLSLLLVCNFIFSNLFWHNPINKSIIHRIDAIFVRISLSSVFFYVSFIKEIEFINKLRFYALFILFLSLAKMSNKLSRKKWCSNEHIFYHFLMHLVGIFGSYVAFF
jgi:hypothetical protein